MSSPSAPCVSQLLKSLGIFCPKHLNQCPWAPNRACMLVLFWNFSPQTGHWIRSIEDVLPQGFYSALLENLVSIIVAAHSDDLFGSILRAWNLGLGSGLKFYNFRVCRLILSNLRLKLLLDLMQGPRATNWELFRMNQWPCLVSVYTGKLLTLNPKPNLRKPQAEHDMLRSCVASALPCPVRFTWFQQQSSDLGALIITYTILGAPYLKYSIVAPKILF